MCFSRLLKTERKSDWQRSSDRKTVSPDAIKTKTGSATSPAISPGNVIRSGRESAIRSGNGNESDGIATGGTPSRRRRGRKNEIGIGEF